MQEAESPVRFTLTIDSNRPKFPVDEAIQQIAWTGHRPDLFAESDVARRKVEEAAGRAKARHGRLYFISGGQRGVDLWAAEAGLAIGVPISIVLPQPVEEFCRAWQQADRDRLIAVLQRAETIEVVDERSELGALAYDLRNERMVRGADVVIAVWTGLRRGGTFHTLCAARTLGVDVEEILLPVRSGIIAAGRGL